MKLEIDCPECGYNLYLVEELSTGETLEITVGKCNTGGCDLIIDNREPEHYECFSELSSFFNNRFNILEIKTQNCTN